MKARILLALALTCSAPTWAADPVQETGHELLRSINMAIAVSNGSANPPDVEFAKAMRATGVVYGAVIGLSYAAGAHNRDVTCAPTHVPMKEISMFADEHPKALDMSDKFFLIYALTNLYPCLK